MGRRIVMSIDNRRVRGTLNDTETARAVAALLPFELLMCGTGIDLCGKMPRPLPADPALVHRGWVNGDINYNPGGGWLAILFDDEENSRRYCDQLTIGRVTDPACSLRGIVGRHLVRFEDAEGSADAAAAAGSAPAVGSAAHGAPAVSEDTRDAGQRPGGDTVTQIERGGDGA